MSIEKNNRRKALKNIAVPKTVEEKYNKLKQKNPQLDLLRDTFGLELEL